MSTEEAEYFDKYFQQGERKAKGWFEKCLCAFFPTVFDDMGKLLTALGDVKGKRILELGCGVGVLVAAMASKGAYVLAIDISPIAVKKTQMRCKEFNGQVVVQLMDANVELQCISESFDLVVGRDVLHHLDYVKVVREISRVLKPHGRAVFIEPLAHNPLVNIWRHLTPSMRTSSEHPLCYSDILEMGNCFSSVKYQEFYFLPLFSSVVFLLTFSRRAKEKSGVILDRFDAPFLRVCKLFRRYSCEVLIEFAN